MNTTTNTGEKSFVVTWLYALFLGNFGADRFYLGSSGLGIAKFLTFGGFGVWTLFDIVKVLSGSETDAEGRPLAGQEAHLVTAWIITAVLSLGWFVFMIFALTSFFAGLSSAGF